MEKEKTWIEKQRKWRESKSNQVKEEIKKKLEVKQNMKKIKTLEWEKKSTNLH